MKSRMLGLTLAVAAIVVAACGAWTTASLAPSTGASVASPAAQVSAEPSTAASEGPSSEATFAIPSFTFPSSDKALEALIPDKICGQTAIKLSFSGATFAASGDAELKAMLDALGKSPSDVSMAIGAAPAAGKCAAGSSA